MRSRRSSVAETSGSRIQSGGRRHLGYHQLNPHKGFPMLRCCRTALLAAVALLVGCGGDDESGDTGRVFTIELIAEAGDYDISGTVSLPKNTPAGHTIQFIVKGSDGFASAEGVGDTDGARRFGFHVVGAKDGVSYQLRAAVDMDDD